MDNVRKISDNSSDVVNRITQLRYLEVVCNNLCDIERRIITANDKIDNINCYLDGNINDGEVEQPTCGPNNQRENIDFTLKDIDTILTKLENNINRLNNLI